MPGKPETMYSWSSSFCVPARVYYIAEPLSSKEANGIYEEIEKLTCENESQDLYFLLLFRNCSTVVLIAPYQGIFNGFNAGTHPELEETREIIEGRILELVDKLKRRKQE